MSARLCVFANLVLAVVLGLVAVDGQNTHVDYELGQTSRANITLAQAWWTVAGQTAARQQEQPSAPSRHPQRRR
jgi:hypothetical protein